jgi:uncharacterized RDD family membrane protein YckC
VNEYQDFRPPLAPLTDAPLEPLELAGRGSRLGAKIVDGLTILAAVLSVAIVAAMSVPSPEALRGSAHERMFGFTSAALLVVLFGFLALAGLAAWNCVWLHRYGQTLGKRALRIRIVRSNGERASLGRIFGLRYLPMMVLGVLPKLGVLITLADYLLIFRESRQCLHDQFADTIVVKAE